MSSPILHASASSAAIVFAANKSCPLGCGSAVRKYAETYGSGSYEKTLFKIWTCATCGIGLTDPLPTRETAHLLYETRESNDFQPNDSALVARLKSFAAVRDVRSFCRGADPRGTFLDYGCGNGAFVRAIREAFPECQAIGSDLHPSAPPLLKDGSYLPYEKLQPGSCDFVLCRHVLEHTYDPVEFVAGLKRLLRPKGVLGIEVPSLETKVKALFGKHWDNYYAPFHPVHFTRQSLRRAIESAGMRVVREGGAEMPKMGRSLRNLIGCEYNTALFAAGMLLQPFQVAIGALSGTHVCLRAWASLEDSASVPSHA